MRRRSIITEQEQNRQYLTFTALENGTFTLTIGSGVPVSTLSFVSYSTDNGANWITTNNVDNQQVIVTTPTITAGKKVLWKGLGTGVSVNNTSTGYSCFSSTGRFEASGNIMSLLYGDNFEGQISLEGSNYVFNSLFLNNKNVTSAKNLSLPSTTLADNCYRSMFFGCISLTTAPSVLPSTTLATYCYRTMFYGCTNLTSAPELPATTLANNCYYEMFGSCTNLTAAPQLPATTLANYCYNNMFNGCTSLTTAPSELPATTLATGCYSAMFYKCTSLTTTPELPATTLATYCYAGMFKGCTNLTTAPELPVTTLAQGCYSEMFRDCTNLTTAPELPATTLADYCYQNMFSGCTSLSSITCLATNISASGCTENWVRSVMASGTFTKAASMTNWTTGNNGIPSGWTIMSFVPFNPDISLSPAGYVTFTANQPNSAIGLARKSTNQTMYISKNGTLWQEINGGESFLMKNQGDTYYICGMLSGNNTLSNYSQFSITGSVAASGNCNALWNYTNLNAQLRELCGYNLFKDCTSLTSAPELPATTLANSCYDSMFSECTSLTTAPELPATTLASNCYYGMFKGCTSLTIAPELPSTALTFNCYNSMFWNCTSLTTAPELPATTLATQCYGNMFYGCTNLTKAPELPATTLASRCYYLMLYNTNVIPDCTNIDFSSQSVVASSGLIGLFAGTKITDAQLDVILKEHGINDYSLPVMTLTVGCYNSMFQDCTSLTIAPELPATTLAEYCYNNMFYKCTSLTTAPSVLPATTLAQSCYRGMFLGCTSLITAPSELPATTLAKDCYNFMFTDCTSLTTAPELPATTLADSCYYHMFLNCRSLMTAPALPATALADSCYYGMFTNCTSLTTAPELPATTLVNSCYYYMFSGCTSLNFVNCKATSISATDSTTMWLNGVTSSGIFIKNSGTNWPNGSSGIPVGWLVKDERDFQYLTFEALESGTFTVNLPNDLNTTLVKSISYSLDDGETWVTTQNVNNQQVSITTPTIPSGGTVLWKGDAVSFDGSVSIQSTGRFNASGNIISIFFGDDFSGNKTIPESSALKSFFKDSKIEDASALYLSATTLATRCYEGMFQGCTGLTAAPKLPATTMAESCYGSMFYGCTSLTTAPELPATRLASSCYGGMFEGCTSLATAPELPATALGQSCYNGMFSNCTSLTTAPSMLPATTLTSNCYDSMFYGCTSLTTVPQLPARTLVSSCYEGMFYGCTNLSSIVCKATDISATDCTKNWVNGVAASGTFKKAKDMEDWTTGVSGIPSGWTVEERGGGSENLRLWLDDFYFMGDYTMQDFIDDPESCNSNGYEDLNETIEIDGDEYYLFMNVLGEGMGNLQYALLTTNNQSTLQAQSIVNDPLSTFPAFYSLLNEDQESTYEPGNPQQLIKYDNGTIWVDDFWHDYNLIDWYNGNVDSMPAWFDYKGETFELDGDEYYLWESTGDDWDYSRAYILTNTIDYDELVSQSLAEDVAAIPTSIICYLNDDQEESYSGDDQLLIRVEDLDA